MKTGERLSLRSRLLLGIFVPVVCFVLINTVSLYRQALRSADTAYDHTLLASAKSIGEDLEVLGSGADARASATVSYSALEPFEADNRSRMFYKVTGFKGEMVSGFESLPTWHGTLPDRGIYAALVDFYDDVYEGYSQCVSRCCSSPSPASTAAASRRSRWLKRLSCARPSRTRS